jgi:IS30 family transposase
MAQMGRPGLSAAQKGELWRRWKEGQSLSEIGLALDRHAGSIHGVIRLRGGYAPTERRRSSLALRPEEREEISLGVSAQTSLRQIAAKLGRSASTVSREIARHGGFTRYKAVEADSRAWDNARRPKRCRLAQNGRLRLIVAQKLQKDWSPEQIAGWLAVRYRGEDSMRVSHETIYRSLFVQARGVLKKELMEHLRGRRMMRRSQKSTTAGQPRGRIIDAVSIRERPAEIEDRAVPGHWEGDLISGSNNTHIATLVERQSRFTMLVKLDGKDAPNVINALAK